MHHLPGRARLHCCPTHLKTLTRARAMKEPWPSLEDQPAGRGLLKGLGDWALWQEGSSDNVQCTVELCENTSSWGMMAAA